jgi:nucleoside-diphosphate-sugar epimerase
MRRVPTDARCVVITGAVGGIGSVIVEQLGTRWRIRATDVHAGDGVQALDVTNLEHCVAVFSEADAVVHLAANPSPEADWEALRGANMEGSYAVAAAARECGVRRLVLASSLQVMSGDPETVQRRTDDAPWPANLSGATKVWAEALGSWVASGRKDS